MDTRIPTVTPQDSVEHVVHLMADQELAAVPVINEGGRCVGIVTEKDLVIADEEGDLHIPHYIELFGGLLFFPPELRMFEQRLKKASAARVQDLMTQPPVTIDPRASIHEAAHAIVAHGHSRVPVVEHGRYVGLVTRADVLAALSDEEE